MWIWREKKDNPHYKRLTLIIEHNPRPWGEQLLGYGILFLILAAIYVLMSLNYVPFYYLFLFVLFTFTMLTSTVAAWFVAQDCGGVAYELVRLTVLSAKKLAIGYWHAFLKRLLWQLRWPPLAFPLIIVVMNIYFIYFKIQQQPSFYRTTYWETALLDLGIGWLVSLSVVWGYWIYPFVGISIGLSLNRPMLSAVVTLSIIPILAGLWGFYALIFVYLLPMVLVLIFGLSIFMSIIVIVTMLGLASLFLTLILLVMGEMTHGFAKENI